MALEDLTGPNKYIANLVPANPPETDPAEQGCDHIQGIKNVLQNSFPGMAGAYQIASAQGTGPDSMTKKSYVDLKAIPIIQGSDTHRSIQYDDGLQIVLYNAQRADIAIDNAYGGFFYGDFNWTYLAPFVAPPVVVCSLFSAVEQAGWGSVGIGGSPNTIAVLRGLDIASRPLGTTINISAMAIGRWK